MKFKGCFAITKYTILSSSCFHCWRLKIEGVCDCWGWIQESLSLINEAALYSGVTTADTCVSVVRWQQGEQSVSGWVLTFSIFALCADSSLHWCRWCSADGTTDVLGSLFICCLIIFFKYFRRFCQFLTVCVLLSLLVAQWRFNILNLLTKSLHW